MWIIRRIRSKIRWTLNFEIYVTETIEMWIEESTTLNWTGWNELSQIIFLQLFIKSYEHMVHKKEFTHLIHKWFYMLGNTSRRWKQYFSLEHYI